MKTRAIVAPHRTETHRIEERKTLKPAEQKTVDHAIREAAADKKPIDTLEKAPKSQPPKSQPKVVVQPSIATEVNPKLQAALTSLRNLPIGSTAGIRIDATKGTIMIDPPGTGGRGERGSGSIRVFDMDAKTVVPAFVVNAKTVKEVTGLFAEKLQEHLRKFDPDATVVSVVTGEYGGVAIVPRPPVAVTLEEAKAQAIMRLSLHLANEGKNRASTDGQ